MCARVDVSMYVCSLRVYARNSMKHCTKKLERSFFGCLVFGCYKHHPKMNLRRTTNWVRQVKTRRPTICAHHTHDTAWIGVRNSFQLLMKPKYYSEFRSICFRCCYLVRPLISGVDIEFREIYATMIMPNSHTLTHTYTHTHVRVCIHLRSEHIHHKRKK